MLAWADPNWEMQNVCNVFGIDLNIFLYSRNSGPLDTRQTMIQFYPNEDVLCLSNDKLPSKHTIYLYYQVDTHYETIIAKPPNFETPAEQGQPHSFVGEDLVFRTGIPSKGRPRKTSRMGTPSKTGLRKGKDYIDVQATISVVDGMNPDLEPRSFTK